MAEITIKLSYTLPPVSPLNDRDAARLDASDLDNMDRDALALELGRVKMCRMFGDLQHAPCWAASWLRNRQEAIERRLRGGGR
jgi:hypothetical protein